MTKQKKAQAAMEFLMTYGWAILAAIVVIGALILYFKPASVITGSTFLSPPFYAVGASSNGTHVFLEVKNNGAEELNVTTFNLTIKSPKDGKCNGGGSYTEGIAIKSGETKVLNKSDCNLEGKKTLNADVVIIYKKEGSDLEQRSTGSINTAIS